MADFQPDIQFVQKSNGDLIVSIDSYEAMEHEIGFQSAQQRSFSIGSEVFLVDQCYEIVDFKVTFISKDFALYPSARTVILVKLCD